MKVSVLICSHDRADELCRTLESLVSGRNLERQDWEVLVVRDLLRNDATSSVGRDFQQRFPGRIRFLEHSSKGKSHSLNLGISEARGEWLAMIDDDVLCSEDYIAAISQTFRDHPADAAQGRVILDWIGCMPQWISTQAAEHIGQRDFGDQVIPFYNRSISGANMVVRTDVARKLGGFAPELGPAASGANEDTEFSRRLRKAGYCQLYAPRILVRHRTLYTQTTPAAMRKRSVVQGRSEAYHEPLWEPLSRVTRWAVKQCLVLEFRALRLSLRGEHAEARRLQCESGQLVGFVSQHWRFRLGRPRELSYPLLNSEVPVGRGAQEEAVLKETPEPAANAGGGH
jgi:GT2 family glycosyltransferase